MDAAVQAGSQLSREQPEGETVEGVLERAVLNAGLITESNYGDLKKIKWTRSSRTDKGVHSLASVFSLRALVSDARFDPDPEGLGYAAAINQHLPPAVRVLSVQRVNRHFNARFWCICRTYDYYLPAFCLGLSLGDDDASKAADEKVLATFRAALKAFEGRHPFHNYTPSKSSGKQKQEVEWRNRERGKGRGKGSKDQEDSDMDEMEEVDEMEVEMLQEEQQQQQQQQPGLGNVARTLAEPLHLGMQPEVVAPTNPSQYGPGGAGGGGTPGGAAAAGPGTGALSEGLSGQEGGPASSSAAAEQPEEQQQKRWVQLVQFIGDQLPMDKRIVQSHYRAMESWTVEDPAPLVPGGVVCLRLTVTGQSFLLHHIRHMIGAAVAVARGLLSQEALELSLGAPVRLPVPRAPPHTLMLAGSRFSPFRNGGQEEATVSKWTGAELALREGGLAAQASFRTTQLASAVEALLHHHDWQYFSDTLPRYEWPPELVASVSQQHRDWLATVQATRRAAQETADSSSAQEQQQQQQAAESPAEPKDGLPASSPAPAPAAAAAAPGAARVSLKTVMLALMGTAAALLLRGW